MTELGFLTDEELTFVPEIEPLTRAQCLARAYHYQDLARQEPDSARFWYGRAKYWGRRSWTVQ